MLKKIIRAGMGFLMLTLIMALPVWAGGGADPKGMDITIGNWWADYDVNTFQPQSDADEKTLDYRKRLLATQGFQMRERNIASWEQMAQIAATSTMAGNPRATIFILQPDWAMTLYNRKLLSPLDTKAVNFNSTKPVEWNQDVTKAFTFAGKTYAFNPQGYGGSQHAQVVYFNKRLFREAGLDPNLPYDLQKNGNWNWDEFLRICKQLTRDTNNDGIPDVYALPQDLSTEILDAIIASNGANYVTRDSSGKFVNATNRPEFIEALQYAIRLKNEGVMMPRPEDSNWDWYQGMFTDGRVAMRIEPHYVAGQLAGMRDDWGMVLPPKGPRAPNRDYVVYTDENVMVIPNKIAGKDVTPDQVDKILKAVELWYTPVDDDWKSGMYNTYRDSRAVDETIAMIRNPKYSVWKNHLFIPGLNRGDIAWEMWWFEGDPAQLVESVSQAWDALINDANGIR